MTNRGHDGICNLHFCNLHFCFSGWLPIKLCQYKMQEILLGWRRNKEFVPSYYFLLVVPVRITLVMLLHSNRAIPSCWRTSFIPSSCPRDPKSSWPELQSQRSGPHFHRALLSCSDTSKSEQWSLLRGFQLYRRPPLNFNNFKFFLCSLSSRGGSCFLQLLLHFAFSVSEQFFWAI